MAYYKYPNFLHQQSGSEFDQIHLPGQLVPYSGVYSCTQCGQSVVSTKNNTLPPQNHHQHSPPAPIQWVLTVKAHYA
jgi:hypothetical protein